MLFQIPHLWCREVAEQTSMLPGSCEIKFEYGWPGWHLKIGSNCWLTWKARNVSTASRVSQLLGMVSVLMKNHMFELLWQYAQEHWHGISSYPKFGTQDVFAGVHSNQFHVTTQATPVHWQKHIRHIWAEAGLWSQVQYMCNKKKKLNPPKPTCKLQHDQMSARNAKQDSVTIFASCFWNIQCS